MLLISPKKCALSQDGFDYLDPALDRPVLSSTPSTDPDTMNHLWVQQEMSNLPRQLVDIAGLMNEAVFAMLDAVSH